MKYCRNCGAALEEEDQFCGKCGSACRETDPNEASPGKCCQKKRKLLFVCLAVLAVIGVGMGVYIVWKNGPEQMALRDVQDRNYEALLERIREEPVLRENASLEQAVIDRVCQLQTEYEAESMTYESVCEELADIGALEISGTLSQLELVQEAIRKLFISRTYKTVYLCTSTVNTDTSFRRTTEWSYDEQGRLTGYSEGIKSLIEENSSTDQHMGYIYDYDQSGNIRAVTIEHNNGWDSLQAHYAGGLLVSYSGEVDGEWGEYRFSYDEDENIILREVVDSDGNVEETMELSYDEHGNLLELKLLLSGFIMVRIYNEDGQLLEAYTGMNQSTGISYLQRNVFGYGKDGKQNYQATYSGNSDEPVSVSWSNYDEQGRVTAIDMEIDGIIVESEAQWNESERTMTISYSYGGVEVTMLMEYDEANNCTRSANYANGTLLSETVYTWAALLLPPDYEKPDIFEPQFIVQTGLY